MSHIRKCIKDISSEPKLGSCL